MASSASSLCWPYEKATSDPHSSQGLDARQAASSNAARSILADREMTSYLIEAEQVGIELQDAQSHAILGRIDQRCENYGRVAIPNRFSPTGFRYWGRSIAAAIRAHEQIVSLRSYPRPEHAPLPCIASSTATALGVRKR